MINKTYKEIYESLNDVMLFKKDRFLIYFLDEKKNLHFKWIQNDIKFDDIKNFYTSLRDFIVSKDYKDIYLVVQDDTLSDMEIVVINALGFEEIYSNSKKLFSIWSLPQNFIIPSFKHAFSRKNENEDVVENLHDAITLYLHEDNLNWTKLGMLVSFVFAIMTAFFIVLDQAKTPANLFLSTILVSIGLIITYIFSEKIKSGIYYMSQHKSKVKKSERIVQFFKPNHIMLINVLDKKVSKTSTTIQLMLIMPKLAYVIWPICFIMSILNYLS